MSTYNEADHPRGEGGKYTNKNESSTPNELPVESPRTVFEREIADKLNRVYDDPREALAAAVDIEAYTDGGGVGLHRNADGTVSLADDVDAHNVMCTVGFDKDGNIAFDPDFGWDSPDDYQICYDGQPQRWEELQPVKDFLNGATDSVNVYTNLPSVMRETADMREDDEPYYDTDTTLYLMCAETPTSTPPAAHTPVQDKPFTTPQIINLNARDLNDPVERVDFSEQDLTQADWDNIIMRDCLLDDADMSTSRMNHMTFQDCSLTQSTGNGAHFYSSWFDRCAMPDSDYVYADFTRATFTHCNMWGTRFTHARMDSNTRFEHCDLQHADFRGTGLTPNDTRFVDCTIDQTTLFD